MRKLFNSFFIFALALNLLFIGSATPVHGQGNGQDGEVTGQNCDVNNDGVVDETEAAECETNGQADNGDRGHGNDSDGCDEDNPGNGDECPTEEPTDQPADAPADEPADAPADEPADAPADEPADAPADEPADAPADEEVPADEGTTDQAVPDEGKTDEATTDEAVVDDGTGPEADTPTLIESQGDGDIGSSALTGSWTTQNLIYQNLGLGTATVQTDIYNSGSASSLPTNGNPIVTFNPSIAANSGATQSLSSLSAGQYAAVVTADQSLTVVANHANSSEQAGDFYLGISAPAQQFYLPRILRNWAGIQSHFFIQNAHTAAQTISVQVTRYAGACLTSNPPTQVSFTRNYNNVLPNTSFRVDFANDAAYNNFGSGNCAGGYAIISGASGNIAVVIDNYQDSGLGTAFNNQTSAQGLPTTYAGRELIAPRVSKGFFGQRTGVNIINVGGAQTTVTLTYNRTAHNFSPADPGGTQVAQITLAAGEAGNFTFPGLNFRNNSFGSARIVSSNSDILGMVFNGKVDPIGGWDGGAETPAVPTTGIATTKAAVPFAALSNNWLPGLNVFAPTAGTTINTTWNRINSSGNILQTVTPPSNVTTGPDQTVGYATNLIANSGATDNFWVVYITADQPIIALQNMVQKQQNYIAQIIGQNY